MHFYCFVLLCLYCSRQEIDRSFWNDHVAKNMVYQKFYEAKIADNYKLLSPLITQKVYLKSICDKIAIVA